MTIGQQGITAQAIGDAVPDSPERHPSTTPTILPPATPSSDLTLPEASRLENAWVRAAYWGFALWAAYLAAVQFIPSVWTASVALLDLALWPLMRALGPFWGVAALAALTAFGSMLCQWLCTDVRRLREVKRQTLAIAQALHGISAGSPEDKALSRLLRAGEWRVARAALVPLGLLLGPVLVSFMWLPVRVEPSHINPAPGAHVRMQAAIDGEFNGPLSVRTTGAAFNDGTTSADVQVVSVRSTFEELRRELAEAQAGRPYTPAVRQHLEATGKSAKDADDTLKAFLATPMPPRVLQWSLTAPPGKPQPFSIDIGAGPSGTLGRAQLALATGHAQPPPLQLRSEGDDRILTQKGDAAVHDVRVQFTDPRPPEARAFWRPFALAGLTWDAGWMSLYLAVYLPVMLLTKRLLRLP